MAASSSGMRTYSSSEMTMVPVEDMDPSVAELFRLYQDFNQRQKAYFDSIMLVLSDPVTALINLQADALNKKISLKIQGITDSVNVKVGQHIGFVVDLRTGEAHAQL